jgi:formate dehydrogenase subunit gamma
MSCQIHFIRIHHKRLPTRTVAVLFVAAMFVHVYMGTIGVEGAFEAMGEGTVDVNWARERHSLWVQDEMSQTGPNKS